VNLSKRLVPIALVAAVPLLSAAGTAGATAREATSCAAIRAADPTAGDGDYTVRVAGASIPVYCHDMGSGSPLDYIELARTGGAYNFSQYTAGGASPGTSVVTHYTKLRIDLHPSSFQPLTFRVNIADETFSSSTGQLCHSSRQPCSGATLVKAMPYAVAFDCVRPGSSSGLANLDLTGTVFEAVNTWTVQAFEGAGSTAYTPQVVKLTGGGFCGWNAPAATYNPHDTNPLQDANGGYDLQLRLHLPLLGGL
jgi:GON domain